MKQGKITLLMFLMGLCLGSMAQTPTTQGTEFWVSFMRNGHREASAANNKLSLIISAKEGCQGLVSNSDASWTANFNVDDHGVTVVEIPGDRAYNDQTDGIANKGILITADDTISLYVGNEAQNSYDAANVLPTDALGKRYLLQTYQSINNPGSTHVQKIRASFLVVATEPTTTVSITPSVTTYGNHPAGQTYSFTLNQGDCYHVMSKNAGETNNSDGDFSGTWIVADKPVAVFNGNCLTTVPVGCMSGNDHVFEQAMPIESWGRRFVVTGTRVPDGMSIGDDRVKVTAFDDQTEVRRNGQLLFTLNARESAEFGLSASDVCCLLEADKPIAAYLYEPSHGTGGDFGDPSMVWISPVEQTLEEVTFSTFELPEPDQEHHVYHYVNVVCYTDHVATVQLDGQSIASDFVTVPSDPLLSYSRRLINPGAHILSCEEGFTAHVYGVGTQIGYAYSVGSSAKQLTKQLYVDDVLSTEYPDGYTICQHTPIDFRFESNYEFEHVDWDFGNGDHDQGSAVTYAYASSGDYGMQAVVYRSMEGNVVPFDTVGLLIRVKPSYEGEIETIRTCASTVTYHQQEYSVPGSYPVTLTSVDNCDSIVMLVLEQGNEIRHDTTVSACVHYEWRGVDYTEPGDKIDTVHNATPEGCDSLYVLHLTLNYPPDDPSRQLERCTSYYWHGMLCDTTGVYRKPFTTPEGCTYDSVLYFTLKVIPPVMDTISSCEPILWHNMTISTSGPYEITEPGPGRCDTLYQLEFILEPLPDKRLDTTVCDRLVWGDQVFTSTGPVSVILPNPDGCDTLLTINLTVNATPSLGEIHGAQQVVMANSYWPGVYTYYLDSVGLDTGMVHWELLGDEGWQIVAHGASCQVTVNSIGSMQLSVWTEGNGECNAESMLSLSSSGFGIDEDDTQALKLYPNPTDGRLFVTGEQLVGMEIYDLMGQRLRVVPSIDENHIETNVLGLKPALYMAKIQTKKGNKLWLFSVL